MKMHYQTTLHNNAGTLCTGEPSSRLAAVCHSQWNGDTSKGDHDQTVANGARLAACWNACHGLDLPDDIPAGAVANLVAAARTLLEAPLDGGMDTSDKIADFRAALAPFTSNVATPVSLDDTSDRRPVWSFEVNGKHVRWCGTLDQWHKDRLAYVDKSEGTWEAHGPHMWRFVEPAGPRRAKRTFTIFRAVKNK